MSLQFLTSIPKKFVVWMGNMGKISAKGHIEDIVSWRIRRYIGESSLTISEETSTITLFWRGGFNPEKIRLVRGTEPWFENIMSNLDKFISLETKIYDKLQQLEDTLNEDAPIKPDAK